MSEPYRYKLVLRFRTSEARSEFVGQLTDGWGENDYDTAWNGGAWKGQEIRVTPVEQAPECTCDAGPFDCGHAPECPALETP